MELENGLDWGPEIAAANLPPGRLGGKLNCLLPAGPGVGCPAVRGGVGGPAGGDCVRGGGDGGGGCGVPPVAGGGPGFNAAATDRL